MLTLLNRTPVTPQEQESLAREIQSTDREIDRLVYELYGLTEDEIKIMVGEVGAKHPKIDSFANN